MVLILEGPAINGRLDFMLAQVRAGPARGACRLQQYRREHLPILGHHHTRRQAALAEQSNAPLVRAVHVGVEINQRGLNIKRFRQGHKLKLQSVVWMTAAERPGAWSLNPAIGNVHSAAGGMGRRLREKGHLRILPGRCSKNVAEGVGRQPAHRRYAHCVSEAHAGLPVAHMNWEFSRSLQASVFAPRQRPDARLAAAAVNQELHAAAALGRAQAAGDFVIAHFAHRAAIPTAAIQGRHAIPLAVEKPIHPLSVQRRHVAQQSRRLLVWPPALVICAQALQDGGQPAGRLPRRFGERQLREWQTRIGSLKTAHSAGTHPRWRFRKQRPSAERGIFAHRHDKKARAALRCKPAGVNHRQVDGVL